MNTVSTYTPPGYTLMGYSTIPYTQGIHRVERGDIGKLWLLQNWTGQFAEARFIVCLVCRH